jgi:hypothetical protein
MVSRAKLNRQLRDQEQKKDSRWKKAKENWKVAIFISLLVVFITLYILFVRAARATEIQCYEIVNETEIPIKDGLIPQKTYKKMLDEWQYRHSQCQDEKEEIIKEYERNISELVVETEEEVCMMDERELLEMWEKLDSFQKRYYFSFLRMGQANVLSFASAIGEQQQQSYIVPMLLNKYADVGLAETKEKVMYYPQFGINYTHIDYFPTVSEPCYYKIETLTDIKTSGMNYGLMVGIPIPIVLTIIILLFYRLKVKSGPIPPY